MSRQTLISYAVLGLLAALLWFHLIVPITSKWQSLHETTQQLQSKILASESKVDDHSNAARVAQVQVEEWLRKGQVISADSPVDADHLLQEQVKGLLQRFDGQARHLRPSHVSLGQGVSQSRLEVNFVIPNANVQAFMLGLVATKPKLQIELLSLRPTWSIADAATATSLASTPLEARMIVHQHMLNSDALPALGNLEFEYSAKPPVEALTHPQPNLLAGLFDRLARARLRYSSVDDYRLAAITLSDVTSSAIVVDKSAGLSHRVSVGDYLDSWLVEDITASSVTLSSGKRQATLRLLSNP